MPRTEPDEVEDGGQPFDAKMSRVVAELNPQFGKSAKLESTIRASLFSVLPCR